MRQAIAFRLATCAPCLARLRRRLVRERGRGPLFDAPSWLRAWERALGSLLDAHHSGPGPQQGPATGDEPGRVGARRWHVVVADLA